MKTILAVAVGPKKDRVIRSKIGLDGVRPYIEGLIDGLAGLNRHIGTDYEIDYRERELDELGSKAGAAEAFKANSEHCAIFGMSTTVVRAAQGVTKSIPVVGIVSDPKAESFTRAANFAGVSGRRSQSAGWGFERFLATVPSLKTVRVLHKPGYGPSERALKLVKAVAKKKSVKITPVPIKTRQDIDKKVSAIPKRDPNKPAVDGIFVLPVDIFLSAATSIIAAAHAKNAPLFYPVPDWVRPGQPSALGAYGVSQRKCGELMAGQLDQIVWEKVSPKRLRVKDADDDAFEWVVSSDVAKALNIKIARVV